MTKISKPPRVAGHQGFEVPLSSLELAVILLHL